MISVSAVINVYDEEPDFIAEAIASVRGQTWPVSDIIIVQDGPRRDYSRLFAQYSDLTIIRQENMGLAAARNSGLQAASGDFIFFLDGDDRLMPNAVAINLSRLSGEPRAVMAYGGWRFIDATGYPHPPANMPPLGSDPYATLLGGNCIGMHATVLYRRASLLEIGGFAVSYRACEDYELYLRMAHKGSILTSNGILAEYRLHGRNMSSDHVMMLLTVLRILAEQTPLLDGRPDWIAARERGEASWRRYYARRQYADLMKVLTGEANARRVFEGLVRMWRIVPLSMLRELVFEMMKRFMDAIRIPYGRPTVGRVDFGQLRRTTPISRWFGFDRGQPVDRRYIEVFLQEHSADIKGRVLEVGDSAYTRMFGGERVTTSEVLHINPDAPGVTYVADLTSGAGIPDATFDCVVLTQTLHLIYDMPAAVRTVRRILKPDGILLLTVPGVSSVDSGEWSSTWFWSLTPASLTRLLEDEFRREDIQVRAQGNVLAATAFLHGLAASELTDEEFAVKDPQYPVIVTARVCKS